MSDILVGTGQLSYLEKRNFTDLPFDESVRFKKVHDFFKVYNRLNFKLLGKIDTNFQFRFRDGVINRVYLFHFFTTGYEGKKPWIVTSSVPVPRWNKNVEKGIRLL